MDVVYHRNCLDGAYSAYAMYLFAKSLTQEALDEFLENVKLFGFDMCASIQTAEKVSSKQDLKPYAAITE